MDLRAVGVRLGSLAWLTLMWVLLWGSIAPGTVLAGAIVAAAVTLLLPLPRVPVEGRVHIRSTVRLGSTIAWYLVTSSIQVAWFCVRPKAPPQSAVLRVPLELRSDFCFALAVNTLNLIPGGVVVRLDPGRRQVYVHVLDAGSEKAVAAFRRQVRSIEQGYLRSFERPEEWRASPLHDEAYELDEPEDPDELPSTVERATADATPAEGDAGEGDAGGAGGSATANDPGRQQ